MTAGSAADVAPDALARRVSVVVLTHNRREQLLQTLACLLRLPARPGLIVVDNGSSDGTAAAVHARFGEAVQLIACPRNLGACGRNAGAGAARTPYVAFCDDDVTWEPGALERACELLDAHAGLALVCAHVLVGAARTPDPTSLRMAAGPPLAGAAGGLHAIAGYLAGASVVRREAFLRVGGYCPRLFIGGEEELVTIDLLAAGWALAYAPGVRAHHRPSPLRDAPRRRWLLERNAILVAVLRYPARQALARAWRVLRHSRRQGNLGRVVPATLAALPWALAARAVAPGVLQGLQPDGR
ncbi:MAG: glycosyltransferase [Burkholderiaceae bacterium]